MSTQFGHLSPSGPPDHNRSKETPPNVVSSENCVCLVLVTFELLFLSNDFNRDTSLVQSLIRADLYKLMLS
jgi:hypothetical protein